MSYRRVARSYRKSIARTYGGFQERPRARLAVMAVLMACVLGAGMAILIVTHSGIGTSRNTANLASSCTTPATTGSASATAAPIYRGFATTQAYWNLRSCPNS